jgi:hypothetical protein
MSWKMLALAVSLLPLSVQAADAPKEGTDSMTIRLVIVSSNTVKLGDRAVYHNDEIGSSQSDTAGSLFDNLAIRCLGIDLFDGGKETGHGYCVKGTKDGEYFEDYEIHDGVGTLKILGGTGKFAGISGTGEWTYTYMSAPDGHGLLVVPEKVHWKLP